MRLPSGDQVGCRASLNASVIGLAIPPAAGSNQSVPCRSITSCFASGDTATAIDVPSFTVTVLTRRPGAGERSGSRGAMEHDTVMHARSDAIDARTFTVE